MNRSEQGQMMNLRIKSTGKAKDMLYKLECKKAFRQRFESATAFIEFSLEQAREFYDRKPFGEIKKHARF